MAINDLDELNDIDLRQMMTCASDPNAEKHNCEECRYCMDHGPGQGKWTHALRRMRLYDGLEPGQEK